MRDGRHKDNDDHLSTTQSGNNRKRFVSDISDSFLIYIVWVATQLITAEIFFWFTQKPFGNAEEMRRRANTIMRDPGRGDLFLAFEHVTSAYVMHWKQKNDTLRWLTRAPCLSCHKDSLYRKHAQNCNIFEEFLKVAKEMVKSVVPWNNQFRKSYKTKKKSEERFLLRLS